MTSNLARLPAGLVIDGWIDLTESGLPPGTDRYRAPEQFSFL